MVVRLSIHLFLLLLIMVKPFYYGGQAVIEGVMMRGKKFIAVAVRRQDGVISVVTEPLRPVYSGRFRETPLVRGIVALVEALIYGVKSLLLSAREYMGDEQEMSKGFTWSALIIGFALSIGLFFVLPMVVVRLFDDYLASSLLSNILEGLLRLFLFVAYLACISLMPDIRRVFAYHGAEHKVINAYEAGAPVELDEVKKYSTAHMRCGTSFIIVVLFLAIIVFALFGRPPIIVRLASRIVLIPLIAALGYEIIRLGAGNAGRRITKILLSPGLALQSLTTREPDDAQIEVAIAAFKGVIEEDQKIPLVDIQQPAVSNQ